MSISLPWRFDAPSSWWNTRNPMVNIKLRLCAPSGQPPLFKQLHRFYGELDQIQQCAEAIKQLKGKLNEHDFSDRIRSLTLRQPTTVGDAILLQDQRRCEYTRLRLLMQILLDRFAPTATDTLSAVRSARRSVLNDCARDLKLQDDHIALAHFNEITDNGHLFKRLEEFRTLAAEDATNGEGEKALLSFAKRVTPTVASTTALGRADMHSDICFDLQVPKSNESCPDQNSDRLLESAISSIVETRKKVSALENISDADRIERRWGACSIVKHGEEELTRLLKLLDERIAGWLPIPEFNKTQMLHSASALIAADYLRFCAVQTKSWALAMIDAEGDIETSVGQACEKVRARFDEVIARCPEQFDPFTTKV